MASKKAIRKYRKANENNRNGVMARENENEAKSEISKIMAKAKIEDNGESGDRSA
jgi:hypothetical protein